MVRQLAFEALKAKHRGLRGGFPENLTFRLHRALSWLQRAEFSADDLDAQFIYNAAAGCGHGGVAARLRFSLINPAATRQADRPLHTAASSREVDSRSKFLSATQDRPLMLKELIERFEKDANRLELATTKGNYRPAFDALHLEHLATDVGQELGFVCYQIR